MKRKDRCTFFSLPAENEPAFLFPKLLYILLQNSSEKIFQIFLKKPVRNAFLKTYIG